MNTLIKLIALIIVMALSASLWLYGVPWFVTFPASALIGAGGLTVAASIIDWLEEDR